MPPIGAKAGADAAADGKMATMASGTPAPGTDSEGVDPQDEVVGILRDLIRIDTTNTGEADTTVGEAEAAEYVEGQLTEVGYTPERFTTTTARRQGVHLRIPGRDPQRGALLLHGHLDVVPAIAADWTVPPFDAAEIDGAIWGRGAVDMKDMDAMLIALVRDWARRGYVPPRDIVVIFTPDEEAGCRQGSHWIVANRPDMLEGVTEAVGEVGGFSLTMPDDHRLYLLQTAEKGIAWLRLTATGPGGHGSMIHRHNPVTELAAATHRLGAHRFPVTMTPTTSACVAGISGPLGVPFDPDDPQHFLTELGSMASILGATLSHTVNPTMLSAGIKANVVPREAHAVVDGRFLPGREDEFLAMVDELLGESVSRESVNFDHGVETTFDGPTIEAMAAAVTAEDPRGTAIPYMMSGGTDAKAWSTVGIRCYGFVPLRLPPELNFPAMFHGVDERVPIESVQFGVRVLQRFIDSC
ncbi:MAG: M20/M25/M40 family metallo-hydrolase [Candidatus Nanopelagicales bacterium]